MSFKELELQNKSQKMYNKDLMQLVYLAKEELQLLYARKKYKLLIYDNQKEEHLMLQKFYTSMMLHKIKIQQKIWDEWKWDQQKF